MVTKSAIFKTRTWKATLLFPKTSRLRFNLIKKITLINKLKKPNAKKIKINIRSTNSPIECEV